MNKTNEKKIYDYIIVGAGPTGLTLAWYLSKNNKVLLIEREKEIGGCHRVRRVNELFSEHGPRIYIDNYNSLKNILREMGTDFHNLFTRYSFNISSIGGKSILNIGWSEFFALGVAYIKFMFSNEWTKKITMAEFMNQNNFSEKTRDYIDRLCRMTDGAGIERYTLYEFFELLNQNILYNIYQPRLPNDKGLFKIWKEKMLEGGNIDLYLDTEVLKLEEKNGLIEKIVMVQRGKIVEKQGKKFILAIPPKNFVTILENSQNPKIANAFGNFNKLVQWAKYTEYFPYISLTYHWDREIELPERWGFPYTAWGVAYIVLSDYMKLEHSKTLITTCITLANAKSPVIGKTANQCTAQELKDEVFRQLKESFPNLPQPTDQILSPGEYFDSENNEWQTIDTAFILTKLGFIENYSNSIPNLYNAGTHNGHSNYAFTSMESAMSNAIYLVNKLRKEKKPIKTGQILTVNKVLIFSIAIIIFLLLTAYYYSVKK